MKSMNKFQDEQLGTNGSSPEISGRYRVVLVVGLLYLASLVVLGPKLRFSQWYMSPGENPGALEAMVWHEGRLEMPGRGIDLALHEGRSYNVFPPLWTIICFVVYGLHGAMIGEPLVFFGPLYVIILAGPIPICFYLAFRRSGLDMCWAAVLAFYAMAGTCLWPVATMCWNGWIYSIQLVLAQTGLALILIDMLGRRRFWLAGVGVLIATWSRQPCAVFALPVLWLAWRSPGRRTALLRAAVPIAIAAAVPMGLNWAKFGSPFETGYRYIFNDAELSHQEVVRGSDGDIEIMSLRYVPRHLYHMWASPPWFNLTHDGLTLSGAGGGTAFWFGSPLVLLALFTIRRWWFDPVRRALMLTTLPIICTALLWHGPIEGQPGYYRYTLEFTLVWLVVAAPATDGGRRRWITLGCLAWSVFYFYMLPLA